MTENFIFKALCISLAAHTAFFWALYIKRVHDPVYNALRKDHVEISYEPGRHLIDIKEHPIKPSQRLDLSSDQKIFSDGTIPVNVGHQKPSLPFGMLYEQSKPERLSVMELSRKISIRPITSAKINNPVYSAYNEIVRERIKERVYANYDKMERGSVYLSFLLNSDGSLQGSRVVPEKTNASEHLQAIALQSLREAGPFPAFLKGMNLSEYPFNIEIQYQVSDD